METVGGLLFGEAAEAHGHGRIRKHMRHSDTYIWTVGAIRRIWNMGALDSMGGHWGRGLDWPAEDFYLDFQNSRCLDLAETWETWEAWSAWEAAGSRIGCQTGPWPSPTHLGSFVDIIYVIILFSLFWLSSTNNDSNPSNRLDDGPHIPRPKCSTSQQLSENGCPFSILDTEAVTTLFQNSTASLSYLLLHFSIA